MMLDSAASMHKTGLDWITFTDSMGYSGVVWKNTVSWNQQKMLLEVYTHTDFSKV